MRCPQTFFSLGALSAMVLATLPAQAATITKLIDFDNRTGKYSVQNPYDTPLLIGTELWFTSELGGTNGFGTLSKYNLTTNTLSYAIRDFGEPDPETLYDQGNTPTSGLVRDGNMLYYTTTKGGTGDKGTLNAYNLTTGTNTVLWNSPASSPSTNPNTPSGSVAVVDRGAAGKDVYFMTTNGGVGSGYGTVQRYNTVTGVTTTVHEFAGGATEGRQPFEGFTQVGNKLYFNTFTGGNATTTGQTPASGNGAGTLSVLDVTTSGSEALTTLAALPLGDGSTRLPAHNPFYSAAMNALFFGTVGTAAQPGSLQKFDIATGTLITLYELTGAPTSSGPFPDGRFIYGSVYEWGGSLYYATRQGGLYGGGTINQFDLTSSTNTVLYNLDSDITDNQSAGNLMGGDVLGGFAFSDWDGIPALYLLTHKGGAYNHGTLLRIDLVPEPSRALLLMAGLGFTFMRRRRRAAA